MKRTLMLAPSLLAVLAPAAAWARVDDQANALTPDAERALDSALSNLHGHRFDVVLVDHSGGARQAFKDHHLGRNDGLIMIGVKDHHVDVELGKGFGAHGLSKAEIQGHIRSDFFPQAKLGNYDQASINLANGLLSETSSNVTTNTGVPHHNYPAPQPHHVGFPWGLVIAIAAIGGAGWWWFRRQGAQNLKPRIVELQRRHAQIVAKALRLDDVDTLGRFREGDVAQQYKTLARRSADLMTESRDFGEQLIQAEELVKKNDSKNAEPLLQRLESRVTGLDSEVSASLTTLDRLEGTSGLKGDEHDLPKLVQRLNRRLQELREAYADLKRRAPAGYDKDSTVERRIDEADRLLTTVPVDVKEAESVVLEATDALDSYRRSIEGEADREVVRQNASYGWAGSSSYLPYVALPPGYSRPYFYTTYYEPPVVVYQDSSGWGGGGGWGGGDSGGSWGSESSASWGNDNDDRANSWGGGGGDSWGSSGGDSWGGGDSGGGGDFGGGGDW